jgi:hypothetical protein
VSEQYPYGLDAWNTDDETKDYTKRFGHAAAVDYIVKSVSAADSTAIEEAFIDLLREEDPANYPSLDDKKAAVINAWIELWLHTQDSWKRPNGFLNGKDYYDVAEREAVEVLSEYYFDFLGVRPLVDALNAEQKTALINEVRYEISDFFRGVSQKNSESILSPDRIQFFLRTIESIKVIASTELWNDPNFVALMTTGENPYINLTEWENIQNDQEKQNRVFAFYRDWYLGNSNMGYEQNAFGGKSGKEIEKQGEGLWLKLLDLDMNEIVSRITFEQFERNYMDGSESSKGMLPYVVVGYYDSSLYPYGDLLISDTLVATYEAWTEELAKNGGYHEDIAEHEAGQWSFVIAPMPTDHATLMKLVEMNYDETGDLRFNLQNSVMDTLGSFNNFIEEGAKIFLYIGIGFAVFSALLLMNFIATSISYKKREIGVLRAVGARSSDVYKIFFSEALLIAAINFILSVAAVITAIFFVNDWMRDSGINITLLSFGVRQVILMMIVSAGVALLASFLPVYNIARRKPIDAIRDK